MSNTIYYYVTIIEINLSGNMNHTINKFKTIEDLSMYLTKFRNTWYENCHETWDDLMIGFSFPSEYLFSAASLKVKLDMQEERFRKNLPITIWNPENEICKYIPLEINIRKGK
jgi:hypothetical protein